MILDFFEDGIFAAIAAIGFAAISNPPKSAFKYLAILAAFGHMTRFALMNWCGQHIVLSSLAGALIIGIGAVITAPRAKCVPETFSYPALLPMIPGIYAYKSIQAIGMMLCVTNEPQFIHYTYLAIFNGLTTILVIMSMFIGQMLPSMLLKNIVYTSTKGTLPEDY